MRRPQVYLDHLNDAGMLEAALPKRGDKYAGHLSACSAESFLRLKPILKLSEKPWLAGQLDDLNLETQMIIQLIGKQLLTKTVLILIY